MSRKNIEDVYPLTPMQEGMLFHSLYAPDSGVYITQVMCAMRNLNVSAFAQTWQHVVDRHPILRTAFVWKHTTKPRQIVGRRVGISLDQHDLRGLAAARQEETIEAYLQEDQRRGFDLSKAPLMRVALFHLSDNTQHFVWTHHHILLDGWSTSLLFRELLLFYEAFSHHQSLSLPRPRPFRDFITFLHQQPHDAAEAFWRRYLDGFSMPTILSLPKPTGSQANSGYGHYQLSLSMDESRAVQRFAREQQVTINTIVQGAWALLLSRYSGQTDVLYGAVVSGRPAEMLGSGQMVGIFINTVAVRVQVRAGESVGEWLRGLQREQVEVRQYEQTPLWEVQGYSEVGRGVGLFDSIMAFENYPVAEAVAEGRSSLGIKEVEVQERTNYELTLTVSPGTVLTLRVNYDVEKVREEAVGRLAEHLGQLMRELVKDGERKLSKIELIGKEEREVLIEQWAHGPVAEKQDLAVETLPHLFEAQAVRAAGEVAVICGGEQLTYLELNERANQLAHYLRELGVGPDKLVGIFIERSVDMLIAMLGVMKAGGAYVPLDTSYPLDRLAFMIEDGPLAAILTREEESDRLPAHFVQIVYMDSEWPAIEQYGKENPLQEISEDNLAYVIYTSGSTGKPKGVMVTHAGLVNYLNWSTAAYRVAEGRGAPVHSSIAGDLTVTSLFAPLLAGQSVLLLPGEHEIEELSRALQQGEQFSFLKITPAHLEILNHTLDANGKIPGTKALVIGGEALGGEKLKWWRERAPATRVINEYGPTETVVGCCVYEVAAGDVGNGPVPIGRPIANTQAYVLDEHMRLVPVGATGELYIGGLGVARGYLNSANLTAEKFMPNPFGNEPGARLYRTGDLVRYLEDGNLEYLDRADYQIKLRGFRVEPGEIEALLVQHTGVREAVVVAREVDKGDKRLVAYLLGREEYQPTGEQLRDYLKDKIPEYMVPSAWVWLSAMPLTQNGKIDRRALPAPEQVRADRNQGHDRPRSPLEELLSGIWSEVLKIERVGREENFFELGGHSLLVTQVISRVRERLHVDVSLPQLFDAPTIAEMAAHIETALKHETAIPAPPIQTVSRAEPLPLSFAQQRLWFLEQLEPGTSAYNLPVALRLTGSLNPSALEHSINQVIRRHESLRTSFESINGEPVQIISEEIDLPLEVIDLTHLSTEERDTEVEREARSEATAAFDLGHAPLMKVKLLRVGAAEHVLLLTMHHIVTDGWSMGVLVRDVSRLYESAEQGVESELPELRIQYGDYAVWQREWMQEEVLEEQLRYWREQLHDAPALLELPTDRVRPAIKTYNGAYLKFGLTKELGESLKRLSGQEGVTLFMTLLAAFQVLLHRYTGQADIVVGTPIANRNRSEIENLIGFFVNTLAIRGDLNGNPKFSELLGRVRERMLKAYVYQDLPFEQLVESLQLKRSVSHTPIFQVVFAFQNIPYEAFEMPGLALSRLEIESGTAKFDLMLEVIDAQEELLCAFEYNSDLFDENTIARMAAHYRSLLEAIVVDAEQRIMALPLLSADERELLLAQCCQSAGEFTKQQCLHQLFESQVARTPNNIAVVCEQRQLTYQELNQRANRLAHQLRELDIGPDALVGISIERSIEMIVGVLGILKAGGAYLPLDPSYPPERLAFMLRDAQAKVLLTQQSLREALPDYEGQVICLDDGGLMAAPGDDENLSVAISPDNCAYVIYTSGSTGMPKGTMVSHYNVVRLFQATDSCFDFNERDVWSMFHSYSFDFSVWEMWGALLKGGRLVVVPYWVSRSPEAFYHLLSEQGVTILNQTPSAFRQLIVQEQHAGRNQSLRLRWVIFGGEALEMESLRPWYEMRGDEQPRLVNMYGITETTVHVTYRALRQADVGGGSVIGSGLDDLQVYVLDEELEPVPVGVAGEIYVGGGGLARGYLHRPELTAERFMPNPFSTQPGARIYRSGDSGRYLTGGGIEYLGRVDQQVKVRGYRIELGEIESVLGQHMSVREAVVVTREAISGEKSLTAYIVPESEQEVQVNELRRHLKQKLPEYMMPASFVILDALPLTSHNKLDRRALPDPEPYHPELESTFIPPQTELEKALCHIWQTTLQVEMVGIDDNFFDIGGHSLLVVQVQHRLRQDLNITVPVIDLFLHPTINALSKHLSQQQTETISFQQVHDEARRQKEAINRQRQLARRKRQET